jgi:hypothetical protein
MPGMRFIGEAYQRARLTRIRIFSKGDRMLEEAGHVALILINQRSAMIHHLEVWLIIRGMHLLLKQEHAEYLDSAQKPISWRLSIRDA